MSVLVSREESLVERSVEEAKRPALERLSYSWKTEVKKDLWFAAEAAVIL